MLLFVLLFNVSYCRVVSHAAAEWLLMCRVHVCSPGVAAGCVCIDNVLFLASAVLCLLGG
jgi:hypothetical protein